jgi:hypothetical protein
LPGSHKTINKTPRDTRQLSDQEIIQPLAIPVGRNADMPNLMTALFRAHKYRNSKMKGIAVDFSGPD